MDNPHKHFLQKILNLFHEFFLMNVVEGDG